MNTHLAQTYTWSDLISKEESENLCEFIENNFSGYEPPTSGAKTQDGKYKKQISTVKLIKYIKLEPFLGQFLDHAINIANLDFGYITFAPFGGQNLNYNIYQSQDKDHYEWHIDESGSETTDVKLTLLINLSTEPYEGGEFQTFVNGGATSHPTFDKPGSAIMFKSQLNHRVLPVTSGTRKSLTIFIYGPKFQ